MFKKYDIIPILKREQTLASVLKTPEKIYTMAFFLLKDYLSLIERGFDPSKNREMFKTTLLSQIVLTLQRARAEIPDSNSLLRIVDILIDNISRVEKIEIKKIAIYYSLCRHRRRLAKLLSSIGNPKCQSP